MTPAAYTLKGVNSDATTCTACGRTNLKAPKPPRGTKMTNTDNLTQKIEDMIERTKMDVDYATEQIASGLADMERYIEQAREALAKDYAAPAGYDPEAIGRRIEDAMQDRARNAQQIVKYEALLEAAR